METLEQTITTLVATPVNEFEFSIDLKGMYTKNRQAKIAIKVGNAVFNTHIQFDYDYISGEGPTPLYPAINMDPFKNLMSVGIEIDFYEVLTQYLEKVKVIDEKVAEIKAQKELEIKLLRQSEWTNSWIQDFASTLTYDKNKKIKEALPLATFARIEMDKYVNGASMFITVTYKGVNVIISKQDGTHTFNNGFIPKLTKNEDLTTSIYNDFITLSGGKTVKGKTVGNIFLKMVESIDDRERLINYKKEQIEKQNKETDLRREVLELASGEKVIIREETKYPQQYLRGGYRSDYSNPYKVNHFEIKMGERTLSVNYTKLKEDNICFSIGNLSGLTDEQFKGILKILK